MDDFCVNCNTILEITKTLPIDVVESDTDEKLFASSTPAELSDTSDSGEEDDEKMEIDEEFYEDILKRVESGEKLSAENINDIDVKKMIKSEYYKSIKSKSDIKKKILTMIEDMGNSDEATVFYFFCNKCGYHRPIDPGYSIVTKNSADKPSMHEYSDPAKLRNIVHFGIYPRTREFTCPNDKCVSKKGGVPTEAVMCRPGKTHKTVYVCQHCLSIKHI